MILTKEELLEELKYRICEITFTKVNGEIRTMPCTLRADIIPTPPADVASKSTIKRHEIQNVISVWCIDKQAWRSFRVDNVTDVKINLELHGF
jgi:hypothetical protein